MPNATARSGQQQRSARDIGGGVWHSGIEPDLRPSCRQRRACEHDAVVQSIRTVLPEFELQRRDPPAAPAWRARYLSNDVFGGNEGDGLLEGEPAFERPALL